MWDKNRQHTRIKLCEFESLDAAYEASHLRVDALGFHFFNHHSFEERIRRFSEILPFLPKSVCKVLLSDLPLEKLIECCANLSVDTIQLYPDWDAKEISILRSKIPGTKILKVMSAKDHENRITNPLEFIRHYEPVIDGILLDSFRSGGTGKTADWDHCREIVMQARLPVFLAGGLNAQNVQEAMKKVSPFGVDVETGVSDRISNGPLVKNLEKCRKFVEAVKTTDANISLHNGNALIGRAKS